MRSGLRSCRMKLVIASLEAIEELLPDADDAGREILVEYKAYLRGILRSEVSLPLQVDAAVPLHASAAAGMSPL